MSARAIKYLSLLLVVVFSAGCNDHKAKETQSPTPIFNTNPRLKEITDRISSSPKDAGLYFERGEMLHKLGVDTLAIKDYKMAATLDSSKAEYFSAVGNLLFDHKDVTGSIEWLQKAIAKNPKDQKTHLKIAKLFLYMREHAKGFEEINIVLRQNVYNPEAYFLKGMMYKDMNDTAHAISNFQTAVQVAPDYRDAVIQLGLLYSARKDPLALKYLENAYQMDSLDVFPLFARGVYYQENKDFEAAKAEYKRCIIRNNHYVDAYFNMGSIYLQQDSFAKAYHQYDLATKTDPANPTAYYNRGVCSELMDSVKNAVEDYKQALALDTSYKSPKEALKKLGVK